MAQIKCPKCGEIIKLDKSDYDALLNEVENDEIEKRVSQRTKDVEAKLKAQYDLEANKVKTTQNNTIVDLQSKVKVLEEKLANSKQVTEFEVTKATEALKTKLSDKDQKITVLEGKLTEAVKDAALNEKNLKESYTAQLGMKDEEIQRWKEYRMGDSTKDLGESLEKYCEDSFNEIRADAYPNAYFEKDNEVIEGGKADFIFKDFAVDGVELTSIIFDMKTEKDTTEHKHKNEDFFKKLDSDRQKKGCEYAVLVSTLEADSKLYNKGIVDVSHRYPKMFVVRTQFFLAIIGLIRNMAIKSYEYKKQVVVYQNEHMDITNFENAVKAVTDKINADYEKAGKLYENVDDMCDAMIKKIEAFREVFRKAQGHIGAAQNQLDNLSVRKLTKNNPTMKEKFAELEESK